MKTKQQLIWFFAFMMLVAFAPDAIAQAVDANAPGTVRVNNLANLEALLNIIANSCEIVGLANGGQVILLGIALCFLPDRRKLAALFIPMGVFLLAGGVALPGIINWLVAAARDANLFS